MPWYLLIIILLISISSIGFGAYMVYSAFTGKGIPHPGEDAWPQTKIQYHLRGVVGAALLIFGIYMLSGIALGKF